MHSIESVTGAFPILVFLLLESHDLLVICGQYLSFLHICDITQTVFVIIVVFIYGFYSPILNRTFAPASTRTSLAFRLRSPIGEIFPFLLFLSHKLHKLCDVLHRVKVNIIEVFTAWAVHEFMLLTCQIVDDPF